MIILSKNIGFHKDQYSNNRYLQNKKIFLHQILLILHPPYCIPFLLTKCPRTHQQVVWLMFKVYFWCVTYVSIRFILNYLDKSLLTKFPCLFCIVSTLNSNKHINRICWWTCLFHHQLPGDNLVICPTVPFQHPTAQ